MTSITACSEEFSSETKAIRSKRKLASVSEGGVPSAGIPRRNLLTLCVRNPERHIGQVIGLRVEMLEIHLDGFYLRYHISLVSANTNDSQKM
jgi:hypothetical protein